MVLKEFMETDIYKDAECIEYIDRKGGELEENEKNLSSKSVIDCYEHPNGYLEITLDV